MGTVQTRLQSVFRNRGNATTAAAADFSENLYRYPPSQGNYFAKYFVMGGERFEMQDQDTYLFGSNSDLNYLGTKPLPFPYQPPAKNEPTKTLRSLVHIRKPSVRLVRAEDNEHGAVSPAERTEAESATDSEGQPYNITFSFDTDVRCAITIYYFATEDVSGGLAVYHPRDDSMNSETFHYKRGANQVFNQPTHLIFPSHFTEEEWLLSPNSNVIPIVIQCVVEEEDYIGHAHMLFCSLERSSTDCTFVIKPQKQKQMVDGLSYLLQELYGIENRGNEQADDDADELSDECVICMSETRDTVILPCRHLCLCQGCAAELRSQASNCPMCRAPFTALLHIMSLRKKLSEADATAVDSSPAPETEDELGDCVVCLSVPQDTALQPCGHVCVCSTCSKSLCHQESPNCPICQTPVSGVRLLAASQRPDSPEADSGSVPKGYELVSLIEALNGPVANAQAGSQHQPLPHLDNLPRRASSRKKKKIKSKKSKSQKRAGGDEGPPPSPAGGGELPLAVSATGDNLPKSTFSTDQKLPNTALTLDEDSKILKSQDIKDLPKAPSDFDMNSTVRSTQSSDVEIGICSDDKSVPYDADDMEVAQTLGLHVEDETQNARSVGQEIRVLPKLVAGGNSSPIVQQIIDQKIEYEESTGENETAPSDNTVDVEDVRCTEA